VGAGWADTDDEMTREAAMVATAARINEGVGINVTGSHEEETGICTACGQDLRKSNPLICPSIQRQSGASPLGA
jgi:hypothetical protein